MSNFYKPVNIPNLIELQTQLNSFLTRPEYSGILDNGSYHQFPEGVYSLTDNVAAFIPAIQSINLTLDDINAGMSLTAQSKKSITTIYNISHKYTLEIPLSNSNAAFINFYHSTAPAVETMSDSGILYPKYDEATCMLLEKHEISGAFIMDGSKPRSIECDTASPIHILRFAFPARLADHVRTLFGFV